MRWSCMAYVTVVALAACGSSSAAPSTATGAASSHVAACGPEQALTLAAGQLARVYVTGGEVYGCAAGSARSYRLGASRRTLREERVGAVTVAGRYAAFGLSSSGVDTVSTKVIVRDLADGKQLRALAASDKLLVESFTSVDSIVVRADGAVAWISRTSSVLGHGSAALQVWRADSRGAMLLDTGDRIAPKSLRRTGSTLIWRNGASTRSATLR